MPPFLAVFASQAMGMVVNAVSWRVVEKCWLNFISICLFSIPFPVSQLVAAGHLISFLPRRKSNNNPEFDVREKLEN